MSRLRRALNQMPDEVRAALAEHGLMPAYDARPDYQKNDYLGWIGRARRADTKRKRLDRMLDELHRGGVYMNMEWRG